MLNRLRSLFILLIVAASVTPLPGLAQVYPPDELGPSVWA